MKRIKLNFYLYTVLFVFKAILTHSAMSLSPVDYDINLTRDNAKTFFITNVGDIPATYSVQLENKLELSRYIEFKKMEFRLSPGEKKEITLLVKRPIITDPGVEHVGKLYITEKQKTKNVNYETNTTVNLYGYSGDLKESFELTHFKNEKNFLFGEIVNTSERKSDVDLSLVSESGERLATRKIRVLKGKKFNLADLGEIKEVEVSKKLLLENKDMKIEKEFGRKK